MRFVTLALFALALCAPGCDADGDDNGVDPMSVCKYSYAVTAGTGELGSKCTSDADCQYTCMLPGTDGNATNTVGGFCTRGCDCDDNGDSPPRLTDDEKANGFACFYVGGCFPGQSQGGWRHVVKKCGGVGDCAMNPDYNKCANPGCGIDSLCMAE